MNVIMRSIVETKGVNRARKNFIRPTLAALALLATLHLGTLTARAFAIGVSNPTISGNTFRFNVTALEGSAVVIIGTSDFNNWAVVASFNMPGQNVGENEPPPPPQYVTVSYSQNVAGVSRRFYIAYCPGVAHSQAIGFTKITAPPGYSAIANQLDAQPNNSLSTVFASSSLPSGSALFTYKDNTWYTWSGSNWSGSQTLSPGEGAIFQNNSGGTLTLTLVGLVREGQLTTSMASGMRFVSSQAPQAGGVTSVLGYNAHADDVLYKWNGSGWTTWMYFDEAEAAPDPAGWYDGNFSLNEPSLGVGEACYIEGDANSWVRNFSPWDLWLNSM